MTTQRKSTGAEKRILWEVRKRYDIRPTHKPSTSRTTSTDARSAKPPHASPQKTAPRRQPVDDGGTPPRTPTSRSRRAPRSGGFGKFIRRMLLVSVLLAAITGGVFGYKIIAASNRISTAERSIIGQLKDLLFSDGKTLGGEAEGRINIMLAAIGGEGHAGQNLADTIMVASLAPETNQVALLSIPRDLYVQVPEEDYYSKINAVHAHGESQKSGGGLTTLQASVEEIIGLPIHYHARVDFTAFKQIIDAIGGVDIAIENSFFDYWHKIDFPAGREHMDGERALAYVRARYVEGPEGGDFKRAARQQQILLALREKIFSVNTALDFAALSQILDSVSNNVRTDMHLWEMKRFYELARTIDHAQVGSVVLTTGPKGVLVGTTEVLGGTPASVLKPRVGNFSEIQALAANLLHSTVPNAPAATPAPTPTEAIATPIDPVIDKPSVEIRNGTNITGLASRTQTDLVDDGYEVLAIGNAATRDYTTTTVYVIDAAATAGASAIADTLSAETKPKLPDGESATDAAVLIILGSDAQ